MISHCKHSLTGRYMRDCVDQENTCDDCSIHVSQVQYVEWMEMGVSLEVRPEASEPDEGFWKPVNARTNFYDRVVRWKYCLGCYADRNGNEGLRQLGQMDWRDHPAFHMTLTIRSGAGSNLRAKEWKSDWSAT